MALSPQDKAFYREKLNWKSFGYLFVSTVTIGAVAWPLLFYVQDSAAGNAGQWSSNTVFNLGLMGILLGTAISVVMYSVFKFLLSMEWLPQRRR